MEAAASGRSCKNNKHQKKRVNKAHNLCVEDNFNYDATVCNKHEKDNLKYQENLKEAVRWKNQRLKDLGHKDTEVVAIAKVSPEEL